MEDSGNRGAQRRTVLQSVFRRCRYWSKSRHHNRMAMELGTGNRIICLKIAQQGESVVSAKEYREYADECMGWAKTAGTDKERLNFIEMANTWLQAAALSEAG